MQTSDFAYVLPPALIAQRPLPERDASRLLVLDRATGAICHTMFTELPALLTSDDVLVLNDTRVIPARLQGRKPTGGAVELLLIRRTSPSSYTAMCKPGLSKGTAVACTPALTATVDGVLDDGLRQISFNVAGAALDLLLQQVGRMPTPPYIRERLTDPERYQTTYAQVEGSVAAPTAGLHFTPAMFGRLARAGIDAVTLTLHVGLGTFQPVKSEDITTHRLPREWMRLTPEAADSLNKLKQAGRRLVAVGTTSVRALETACDADGQFAHYEGETSMFITPGFRFRAVDALLTNFHLPRSTLLMLVCAFAGRERVLHMYQEAITAGYRFYSFGDCCLFT